VTLNASLVVKIVEYALPALETQTSWPHPSSTYDAIRWRVRRDGMAWIRKEILDGLPELPDRVDFDDWEKERGLVNLLSEKKNSKPWLPAGLYKRTKGGSLCVLEVGRSLKGVNQAVWLEKPKVRVKVQTRTI
jgi:hypothetical protein